MTPQEPPRAQPDAAPGAVFTDRVGHVGRAGWGEATGSREEGGQQQLVAAQHEKGGTGCHPRVTTAVVPGAPGDPRSSHSQTQWQRTERRGVPDAEPLRCPGPSGLRAAEILPAPGASPDCARQHHPVSWWRRFRGVCGHLVGAAGRRSSTGRAAACPCRTPAGTQAGGGYGCRRETDDPWLALPTGSRLGYFGDDTLRRFRPFARRRFRTRRPFFVLMRTRKPCVRRRRRLFG